MRIKGTKTLTTLCLSVVHSKYTATTALGIDVIISRGRTTRKPKFSPPNTFLLAAIS